MMMDSDRCQRKINKNNKLDLFIQIGEWNGSYSLVVSLLVIVGVTVAVTTFSSFTTTTTTQAMTWGSTIQRMLSEGSLHKDLLPLDSNDVWGTIFTVLGLMIAASGGIGGGGILVPLFILVFGFQARYAIPLSNFCILGSSITNMILNLSKRHPSADRPLVDWDLILVMEPLTMAGAVSHPSLLHTLYSLIMRDRCYCLLSTSDCGGFLE